MKIQASRAAGGYAVLSLAALLGLSSALAAQDVGFIGPSLLGSGPTVGNRAVTESKPENKVWIHDNRWWGSLWSSTALAYRIHRLDPSTHAWIDTGVAVESRPDSHSDALRDGAKLYILTHEFAVGGSPGDPILLQRYSYAAGAYVQDVGFPITIGDSSTETATIEKDSTGRLWAVWKQNLRVYYSYTLGSDTLWSVPAPLPGSTTDFDPDDICGIQRFGGNKIGVMWNDNVQADFLFAVHVDGQDPATWLPVEVAWDGQSDDHINLAADSAGRVFAAVKNDNEDVMLLVRSTAGLWDRFPVVDGNIPSERLSRPIVLLNEVDQTVQVFASFGGAIYKKSSSMNTIAFAPGVGTLVMRDADGLLNDPTSTRQNITTASGLVVLAANLSQAGNYWHHEVAGVSPGLVLNQPTPGTAGVQNAFVVTGATPNKALAFYLSQNTGTRVIARPTCPAGIQTGLGLPLILLGNARSNANGVATLNLVVPASVAGRTYHIQVIEAAQCRASNRITEVF
ncbi:MAG: hypothetical protein HOP15_13620 [Planctomycetes bacterium]|nr:hypothetical protein [Planctomycetota bacterium]